MRTAFMVLTDPTLLLHIVEFQSGLPYAVLAFEPEVYAAEATQFQSRPGECLLHHALLTDNDRMVNRLFRMQEQPHCPTMLQFALGSVLELVCKRGTVEHFELLRDKPGMPASWPSSLLRVTVFALENTSPQRAPKDLVRFHDGQKKKARWLMEHHPEACTDLVLPRDVLISALDLRDFLKELLAANAVALSCFACARSWCLDISILELLVCKYPTAITWELVQQSALHGNLEAVTFIYDHEHELGEGLFTTETMNAAAENGHLDVVRFLHENRTEGRAQVAMVWAAKGGHLEVVQFLLANRTQRVPNAAIKVAATLGGKGRGRGDLAMTQYLIKQRPKAIGDPTKWALNQVVKSVRSSWAKRAIASDNPVQALRAAVIQLTDVEPSSNGTMQSILRAAQQPLPSAHIRCSA